jgi:hypothetical protein
MCSDHGSFLQTLSDAETLSTPSSYSDSKVHSVMKVSISNTNKGVESQKEFHSKILDSTKPSRLGKSNSEFKSCDINSILQTLKGFDQKYSLKPAKEHKVTPVQNDILSTFHTNKYSSADSRKINMSPDLEPNAVESRLLQSPYSSGKSSNRNSRLLSSVDVTPVRPRKGIFNKESFDMSDTFEFNNKSDQISNKSEFSLRNPVTKIERSSHIEMHSKSNNDFIEQSVESSMQTGFTRSENLSFQSHDRSSDCTVLPNNTTSKLEVQLEEMLKSQVSENSLCEGSHTLSSTEHFKKQSNAIKIQRTSEMPASGNTRRQVSTKKPKMEMCDKIKNSLSDISLQEDFSFKSSNSEDRFVNFYSKSAENVFANSEAVHSDNTSFHLKQCTGQDFVSSDIPTSNKSITTHGDAKKVTDLETNQERSVVSEQSNSSVSSVGSHGLFKSGLYTIFTVEDLVAAHEVKILEEKASSDVQSGIKDLMKNKTVSANEDNININTSKAVRSKSEQNTVLESDKEISEEIEEEIESEGIDDLPDSSNMNIKISQNKSVKTNSSFGEMMNKVSSHSEIKHTGKQVLSKKQNVSSEQVSISSRSLSSELMSNKSNQEAIDSEDVLSSSIKLESEDENVSSAHGEPSSSSPLDTKKSMSLSSNCNRTDMKPLSNIQYCSIGIQTDNNMAYHSMCGLHESSFIHPILPSNTGKSQSLQETMPVYRSYSRAMEFQG